MRIRALVVAAIIVAAGCGGSDSSGITGTNNNGNSSGPMSASIDGGTWVAIAPAASYKNNILAIVGIDLGSGITLEVGSAGVTKTGTYQLGFANLNAGIGILTQAGKSWSSSTQGGTGTLDVTTLTANHVVATFSFDAPPQNGGATGTKHVRNGKIDVNF